MDAEKIGKNILKIRKENNFTQQEFAEMFGVTYQAVSKWENGKSIPDIMILKEICKKFNIDINQILEIESLNKKSEDIENSKEKVKQITKNKKIYYIVIVFLLVLFFISICIIGIHFLNKQSFYFKTISSSCDDFKISGSIAYNKEKSSIYISDISYCGENNNTKYKKFEAKLYELKDNIEKKIGENTYYKEGEEILLIEYLNNLKFHIDDYNYICKDRDFEIYLQINAVDNENKVTSYKIKLDLDKECND